MTCNWSPFVICAHTFRAGAKLCKNATMGRRVQNFIRSTGLFSTKMWKKDRGEYFAEMRKKDSEQKIAGNLSF